MTGRARVRTLSPEGSTVIVILTHNRVLHAVNNNCIMIKTIFVTPGGVKISETEALPYLVNCILSYLLTPTRMCGTCNIGVLQQGFVYKIRIATL